MLYLHHGECHERQRAPCRPSAVRLGRGRLPQALGPRVCARNQVYNAGFA
jgi:hypothetical protein